MDAIAVEGLVKRYPVVRRYREMVLRPFARAETTALSGVSFSVARGEIFGVLGPNGAGKTTLLKILATLILPTAGRVLVAGADVGKDPRAVRDAAALAAGDERSLYWRLTCRQNLEFFAVLNDIPRSGRAEAIARAAGAAGLDEDLDRPVMELSSGMKQRLCLARGLLTDPDILLLDEPTRALDPAAAARFRALIRDEMAGRRGKTVVLSTHNISEAEALCGRIAVLERGRLAACASPAELRALLPREPVLVVRMRPAPRETLERFCCERGYRLESAETDGGETVAEISCGADAGDIAPVVGGLAAAGVTVTGCSPRQAGLEDIFERRVL